jgi:hypothetical protein
MDQETDDELIQREQGERKGAGCLIAYLVISVALMLTSCCILLVYEGLRL